MSRDRNHATITTVFARAGAGVVDLSRLGRDVPDLLVGFAGTERLVEIKTEADERLAKERMRPSSRCGTCGKTFRAHRFHKARTMDAKTGEKTECATFQVKMIPNSRTGGKLSRGQEAFAREWPGLPVVVVRTKEDAEDLLAEMRRLEPLRATGKSGNASD